jgi:hypothetical protein
VDLLSKLGKLLCLAGSDMASETTNREKKGGNCHP